MNRPLIHILAAVILLASARPGAVGAQWELRGAVARRDPSYTLGFFLSLAP